MEQSSILINERQTIMKTMKLGNESHANIIFFAEYLTKKNYAPIAELIKDWLNEKMRNDALDLLARVNDLDKNCIKGYFFELGIYCESNTEKAIEHFRLAAEQGHGLAKVVLGCIQGNRGNEEDSEEAVKLCEELVEKYEKNEKDAKSEKDTAESYGYAMAQYCLGMNYHQLQDEDYNDKMIKCFELAAQLRHPRAQLMLGSLYQNGIGIAADEKKAVEYYKMAADQGLFEAITQLGWCYEEGIGLDANMEMAFKHYQRAADWGIPLAQYNLACCYEQGEGVEKDQKKAFEYYHLASDQGQVEAQQYLGECYESGEYVEKNEVLAAMYYQLASDQGSIEARYRLGLCYEFGTGVEKDEIKATMYYQMASDQGSVEARQRLALCYENGLGVEKNLERADILTCDDPKIISDYYQTALQNENNSFLGFYFQLGYCLREMPEISEYDRYMNAIKYYEKTLVTDNPCLWDLYDCYCNIHGVEDTSESRSAFSKYYEKINECIANPKSSAHYHIKKQGYLFLAYCYEKGAQYFKQDLDQALRFYNHIKDVYQEVEKVTKDSKDDKENLELQRVMDDQNTLDFVKRKIESMGGKVSYMGTYTKSVLYAFSTWRVLEIKGIRETIIEYALEFPQTPFNP